jgi:glycosyltransferase involved in cell wall biosynthesis
MIRDFLQKRKAGQLVRKEYATVTSHSVAVGFAFARAGVGGVRNHLESIKRHSQHAVSLFPEVELSRWTLKSNNNAITREALNSVRLSDFGVVHSHVDPNFIRSCAAANQSGTPWVHTYHTLYFPEDWGGQLAPWQEEINRTLIQDASRADVRICISHWLSDLLRCEHGIETQVIPNGVDTEKCDKALPINQRTGYEHLDSYVLFSGSLAEVKNPRLFLDLAARHPELEFVMIGKQLNREHVEPYYGKAVPPNVRLIGSVPHETALSFTRSAAAVVVTSHSEGLPTAVMESMAMEGRVVAPNSFGCRDLIEHNQTGFLYHPGEIDDLSTHLKNALANHIVGAAAREAIARDFAWPAVVQRIDATYSNLLA